MISKLTLRDCRCGCVYLLVLHKNYAGGFVPLTQVALTFCRQLQHDYRGRE